MTLRCSCTPSTYWSSTARIFGRAPLEEGKAALVKLIGPADGLQLSEHSRAMARRFLR
jgi:hypothetical protein